VDTLDSFLYFQFSYAECDFIGGSGGLGMLFVFDGIYQGCCHVGGGLMGSG